MGMNIKYLNNVLKYILEDTLIERRVDDNYINFPFFDGDDKFYLLSNKFLPTNFFYKPVSFYEYCRDMYGLTVDESQYIWEQYRDVIRNNTITESINESVDMSDNKLINLIERILNLDYPNLSECYYDWAEYGCGMGVCCDPYAIGFVLPGEEYQYNDYLFKLVKSGYYDDMGNYPKELSEDLPEVCHEPPNIDEIEFDTILIGEEIFELLNDHFNDPKIWWNQLLFVLNNRFSLNATKIGIGIF
jgi:hypothetical protein